MIGRMREMMKYSAHAPLVHKISESRFDERTASIKPGWEAMVTEGSSLVVGESLFWMRPAVRAVQRIAKESMLALIIAGAIILFTASLRRALFISAVPIYYLLFQSFMHTEFRYTLPMQYFVFVFASIAWVAAFALVWNAVRRVINRKSKSHEAEAAA
jgi:hypothetical protein